MNKYLGKLLCYLTREHDWRFEHGGTAGRWSWRDYGEASLECWRCGKKSKVVKTKNGWKFSHEIS